MSFVRPCRAPVPLVVLLCATLLLRALVPAGWMPAAGVGGLGIELCSGAAPAELAEHVRVARRLLASTLHGAGKDRPNHPDGPGAADRPCVFAGLLPFAPPPVADDIPEWLPPAEGTRFAARTPSAGHGLPAPPPPATGPPFPA